MIIQLVVSNCTIYTKTSLKKAVFLTCKVHDERVHYKQSKRGARATRCDSFGGVKAANLD